MARKARQISGLEVDEISLVDKGANQHAVVTIAKSASGETEETMDIYDEQGNPLDLDDLTDGDVVFDADGEAYQFTLDEEQVEEDEHEPELVGKSFENPFRRNEQVRKSASPSFVEDLRSELSKALSDKDRDAVISKAFGTIEVLHEQVSKAQQAAEHERQVRLHREYTEIAKSYGLPFQDEVLGGVLMRAAESLSREDCEVIAKCLEAAGEAVYMEHGNIGGGSNSDVFDQVSAYANESVSKGLGNSTEELTAEFFMSNPEAYDEYLSERN
jgi:hypothetical protein